MITYLMTTPTQTTTDNKKIFYNMKIKRLYRILTINQSNLSMRKHEILKPTLKKIKKLSLLLRQVSCAWIQ